MPRIFTRKTVWLLTVLGSMAPSNGIESRVCGLNPSSWFKSVISAQSEGLVPQFGNGRFTCSPVIWWWSNWVNRSLGNGDWVVESRLNSGCVAAAASAGTKRIAATNSKVVRLANEFCSVIGRLTGNGPPTGELEQGSGN